MKTIEVVFYVSFVLILFIKLIVSFMLRRVCLEIVLVLRFFRTGMRFGAARYLTVPQVDHTGCVDVAPRRTVSVVNEP